MQITHVLAGEISDYIKKLLAKDVTITKPSGQCIYSCNQEEVNQKINLPSDIFEVLSKVVKKDEEVKLFIPLKYQNEGAAVLVFSESSDEIKKYVSLIKSFAELLIQQYYERHKPILDSTDQFIIKLVHNASINDLPFFESEAKVLGYDLEAKRVAIVIQIKGFLEKYLLSLEQASFERDEVIKSWKRSVENALNGFFTKNADVIVAYLGNDKFVAFKAIEDGDEKSVLKLLKNSSKTIFEPIKKARIADITVGFANPYSSIKGLIIAYREADLALELGTKLWGGNKSYYFGDLGILSIIGHGQRERKIQFANQMLDRLQNEELCKTLECFFEKNLNLTETADKMKIHRNTVIYRLNQISKILGADPRIFEQAMAIKLALLIRKLFV